MLIAAIDVENKAHFSLYDNRKLNDALDGVDDHNGYVDLSQAGDLFSTQVANPYFEIPKFANQLTSPSIQGFDLDNRFAIYVSSGQAAVSENHPSVDTPGISRFQWRSQTAQQVLLHHSNWIGRNIETEGIQVASRVYVGIAYHDAEPYATKTLENRVYWFSNI